MLRTNDKVYLRQLKISANLFLIATKCINMAGVTLSPAKGGFTSNIPTIPPRISLKQWFEGKFGPNDRGIPVILDRYIIFEQKDLQLLIEKEKEKSMDICFAKQELTNSKNTIVAALTYAGQARELSTEWLYVGNSFSQELNFGQINPQLLPTKWNINICDPDTQNFKEGTINLAWGSNYWTASIDSTITTYYFLTVSFNKAQIEKILKGATKVAFSPGFVDLTIAEHAPECVESGIGPKIRIEILTAFALNDNNEVISNAYLPTESWPVKYPPYNGANKFLLHLTKKPLSFLDKICIFFKRLIPS